MRLRAFATMLASAYLLAAPSASASVLSKQNFDRAAEFLQSLQGHHDLIGRGVEINQDGSMISTQECSNLVVQLAKFDSYFYFSTYMKASGVLVQDNFDYAGDVHLRTLNKTDLEISMVHVNDFWARERSVLRIKKDANGKPQWIRFQSSKQTSSWRSPFTWKPVYQRIVNCRAK